MPRSCTVCNHLQRSAIETALLDKTSLRDIARQYATGKDALARHRDSCISAALSKAAEVKATLNGETLLARLKTINAETLTILKEARQDKNGELALKAIARVEKQLELEGKLLGELNDVPTVNLNLSIDKDSHSERAGGLPCRQAGGFPSLDGVEFMTTAQRLAMSLDPVQLARACGIEPDQWQAELLRSVGQQVILNCTRQAGKSTTTALLAVWTALFKPGLLLLVSPSQRQSGELFRKVKEMLKTLGEVISDESALRLELPNGSRIVSLPGEPNTIRGYSKPSLVVIDEAAFISDDLIAAVRPMLAVSKGRIVMLSTPFGQRGAFYEAWINGGDDWQRFTVTAYQCPRIDPLWLEAERRTLGDYFFRSEYLCEFLGTLDAVFRYEDIRRMVTSEIQPLFPISNEVSNDGTARPGRQITPLFSRS